MITLTKKSLLRFGSPVAALFFALSLFAGLWSAPERGWADPISNRIPETLVIETEEGDHTFTVEIARTPNEQRRGLMFRTSLPENHGMLFDYPESRKASMWMENTLIPLDILFIRRNGEIASIAAMAEPYSRERITSGVKVRAALEIGGGEAERLGIKPGDRVRHRFFSPRP